MQTKEKYNLAQEVIDTMTVAQRKRLKEEEAEEYSIVNVVVADDGKTDVHRDIRWVYENINRLLATTPLGNQIIDVGVLRREAPSNGAVALTMYARKDLKGFFKTYLPRIMPKDVEDEDDQNASIDERLKQLDPEFGKLEMYLKHANVKRPRPSERSESQYRVPESRS